MGKLAAIHSSDGRYSAVSYDDPRFKTIIAEPTKKGALVSMFDDKGAPVDQAYFENRKALDVLEEYAKNMGYSLELIEGAAYQHVAVSARCSKCKGIVERELDCKDPAKIDSIPVIPIYTCRECGAKHFCITKEYITRLSARNEPLFSSEELKERNESLDKFVSEIEEYVIRIFASKKINRLVFE